MFLGHRKGQMEEKKTIPITSGCLLENFPLNRRTENNFISDKQNNFIDFP